MNIFTVIFNDTVNVWLNFFGVTAKELEVYTELVPHAVCLYRCSFLDTSQSLLMVMLRL